MRNSVTRYPCLRKCTMCLRVPGRAMDVEVFCDHVVIPEVKKKMKIRCEIGETTRYRGDVNITNVNGDIFYSGCNGEVFSDRVGGEK